MRTNSCGNEIGYSGVGNVELVVGNGELGGGNGELL
jgi:hypothetical protein